MSKPNTWDQSRGTAPRLKKGMMENRKRDRVVLLRKSTVVPNLPATGFFISITPKIEFSNEVVLIFNEHANNGRKLILVLQKLLMTL